jgi:hypothetical protein
VLEFGPGVAPEDLSGERSGNHLVLSLETGETLTVHNFFHGDGRYRPVQEARFEDGTEWSYADLAQLTFGGTEGADRMDGTGSADTMTGLAGNDTLYGNNGDDVLDGGAGDDLLYGGNHQDVLSGGAGNDRLEGNSGHDILAGGAGDDVLIGGTGNDTYRWGLGDGADVIGSVYDRYRANTTSVLEFGPGVAPEDLSGERSGNHLVLSLETGETLTVHNFFHGDGRYRPVQEARFEDGTEWSYADLAQLTFGGTEGADRMDGTGSADTMTGLAGNDTLYGNNGDDVLDGGAGDDLLYGGNHQDVLSGGAGNDRLEGNSGHDILAGGAGDDVLIGGTGNDTYRWGLGDGADVIGSVYDRYRANTTSVLEFGPGVAPEDLSGERSGNHLVLSLETGETLTVHNFFHGDGRYRPVQEARFEDGTEWSYADLAQLTFGGTEGADRMDGTGSADTMTGLAGNDTLYGNNGDDVLDGGAGDDLLYGGNHQDVLSGGAGNDRLEGNSGHDILAGGAGDDVLIGGTGNDTYRWGLGDGADVIGSVYDRYRANTTSVLEFGPGVAPEDLSGERSGNHLVLSLETGETLTVHNFFHGDGRYRPVQEARFEDGTVWGSEQLADPAAALAAMALNAVNLVENGSFELGYDGWTLGGGQPETRYTPGTESSRTSDGASALPLGGWSSSTGQTASQTVGTEASEDYRLSFDAGVNFGSSGQLRIQITDGDTFLFDQVISDEGADLGLESYSFDFTATSSSSTLTFVLEDGSDVDFDIDNVAIIAREDLVGDTFDWA